MESSLSKGRAVRGYTVKGYRALLNGRLPGCPFKGTLDYQAVQHLIIMRKLNASEECARETPRSVFAQWAADVMNTSLWRSAIVDCH